MLCTILSMHVCMHARTHAKILRTLTRMHEQTQTDFSQAPQCHSTASAFLAPRICLSGTIIRELPATAHLEGRLNPHIVVYGTMSTLAEQLQVPFLGQKS